MSKQRRSRVRLLAAERAERGKRSRRSTQRCPFCDRSSQGHGRQEVVDRVEVEAVNTATNELPAPTVVNMAPGAGAERALPLIRSTLVMPPGPSTFEHSEWSADQLHGAVHSAHERDGRNRRCIGWMSWFVLFGLSCTLTSSASPSLRRVCSKMVGQLAAAEHRCSQH